MRDFVECVCTWYSSLRRTQSSSYRNQVNVILPDAQARRECLSGFRVSLREGGQALHVGDADSDQEGGGSTPGQIHLSYCVVPLVSNKELLIWCKHFRVVDLFVLYRPLAALLIYVLSGVGGVRSVLEVMKAALHCGA